MKKAVFSILVLLALGTAAQAQVKVGTVNAAQRPILTDSNGVIHVGGDQIVVTNGLLLVANGTNAAVSVTTAPELTAVVTANTNERVVVTPAGVTTYGADGAVISTHNGDGFIRKARDFPGPGNLRPINSFMSDKVEPDSYMGCTNGMVIQRWDHDGCGTYLGTNTDQRILGSNTIVNLVSNYIDGFVIGLENDPVFTNWWAVTFTSLVNSVETDQVFTNWLATNTFGGGVESDPIFTNWWAVTFTSLVNSVETDQVFTNWLATYNFFTNGNETDQVFTNWLATNTLTAVTWPTLPGAGSNEVDEISIDETIYFDGEVIVGVGTNLLSTDIADFEVAVTSLFITAVETDPVFTNWVATNVITVTETDPVFTNWWAVTFTSLVNSVETDQVFTNWLATNDFSVVVVETDPVFTNWWATTFTNLVNSIETDQVFTNWLANYDFFDNPDETDQIFTNWLATASFGDNLGNHIATSNLNMNATNDVINVKNIDLFGGQGKIELSDQAGFLYVGAGTDVTATDASGASMLFLGDAKADFNDLANGSIWLDPDARIYFGGNVGTWTEANALTIYEGGFATAIWDYQDADLQDIDELEAAVAYLGAWDHVVIGDNNVQGPLNSAGFLRTGSDAVPLLVTAGDQALAYNDLDEQPKLILIPNSISAPDQGYQGAVVLTTANDQPGAMYFGRGLYINNLASAFTVLETNGVWNFRGHTLSNVATAVSGTNAPNWAQVTNYVGDVAGDNLGDHEAAQNLDMNSFSILDVADALADEDGPNWGQVKAYVATNPVGDNLGNHTAVTNLFLEGHRLYVDAAREIYISTNAEGDAYMELPNLAQQFVVNGALWLNMDDTNGMLALGASSDVQFYHDNDGGTPYNNNPVTKLELVNGDISTALAFDGFSAYEFDNDILLEDSRSLLLSASVQGTPDAYLTSDGLNFVIGGTDDNVVEMHFTNATLYRFDANVYFQGKSLNNVQPAFTDDQAPNWGQIKNLITTNDFSGPYAVTNDFNTFYLATDTNRVYLPAADSAARFANDGTKGKTNVYARMIYNDHAAVFNGTNGTFVSVIKPYEYALRAEGSAGQFATLVIDDPGLQASAQFGGTDITTIGGLRGGVEVTQTRPVVLGMSGVDSELNTYEAGAFVDGGTGERMWFGKYVSGTDFEGFASEITEVVTQFVSIATLDYGLEIRNEWPEVAMTNYSIRLSDVQNSKLMTLAGGPVYFSTGAHIDGVEEVECLTDAVAGKDIVNWDTMVDYLADDYDPATTVTGVLRYADMDTGVHAPDGGEIGNEEYTVDFNVTFNQTPSLTLTLEEQGATDTLFLCVPRITALTTTSFNYKIIGSAGIVTNYHRMHWQAFERPTFQAP